ncbi:hypothetical protein Tco_0878792 [Tanacetum coccineum]|uniref:Uncharacterized protein n=1 Tax=Tanacetum coccineum TaxID=301880 RepID=A0ABQ5C2B0_9ASTR
MPLSIKSQNDSFRFEHELKTEMHEDFEYVKSLEKEIDELESEKADFSNMYDLLLEECVSKDVTCSYFASISDLDAYAVYNAYCGDVLCLILTHDACVSRYLKSRGMLELRSLLKCLLVLCKPREKAKKSVETPPISEQLHQLPYSDIQESYYKKLLLEDLQTGMEMVDS